MQRRPSGTFATQKAQIGGGEHGNRDAMPGHKRKQAIRGVNYSAGQRDEGGAGHKWQAEFAETEDESRR